ncbi:MAG: hypothetical protein ABIH72_03665 [archaeon]
MKINKKEVLGRKARISYFQILNLVIAIFAFCYLVGIITDEIKVVEAQPLTPQCCEVTNNNSICQEMVWEQCGGQCQGGFSGCFPGFCEDTTNCDYGCCFDSYQGTCASNSPKAKCEQDGGQWFDEPACNIAECQKACCVLGDETQFVTRDRCNYLADYYGFDFDFRPDVIYEIECIALASTTSTGACVYYGEDENNCEFISQQECQSSGGEFHEDVLCSNSELETNCTRQASTGCADNKNKYNEVYWFDSCGNMENIYDSDRDASWNNGWVLEKNESCNPTNANGNANSLSCGNCFYMLGSICGGAEGSGVTPAEGEYICRDMDCIDEKGNARRNGESWCVYDGSIGESESKSEDIPNVAAVQIIDGEDNLFSTDVVGSRHWKHYCQNGEVKIDPCGDYRTEICVQSDIIVDDSSGEKFSTASCMINPWQECLSYNKEVETDKCEKNFVCRVQKIDIDSDYSFDLCVPKYSPGFDFQSEKGYDVASTICGRASLDCTWVEVKHVDGWECEFNCDCQSKEFAEKMNNYCVSLGDCGAYVNIEGEVTDGGYSVTGAPRLEKSDLEKFEKYAEPIEGQFADARDISSFYGFLGIGELDEYEEADYSDAMYKFMLGTTGAYGVGAVGMITTAALTDGLVVSYSLTKGIVITETASGVISGSQSFGFFAGFANIAIGVAVGAMIGMMIGKMFGLEGEGLLIVTIAGAVAGLVVGAVAAYMQVGIMTLCSTGILCPLAILFIIIVAIVTKLLGIGDTKEHTVSFNCMPWQPPVGGSDCGNCDDNPMHPCSKYRCSSLGAACHFFNEGSEAEICEASKQDAIPPQISPWYNIVTENYTYTEVSNNGYKVRQQDGRCIQAWTNVQFGISLDELGQCKYSLEPGIMPYENMPQFFNNRNLYLRNHSTSINLPSPDALGAHGFDPNRVADYNLYVKCQDDWGAWTPADYVINFCVKPGPDLTAPRIQKTIPEDYAYTKYNSSEKNITIYVNEPVTCRWSTKEFIDYELMEGEFTCPSADVFETPTVWGFNCDTALKLNTTLEENEFYFKCKDQPWYAGENESKRNANTQAYPYSLYPSLSPLKVEGAYPSGEAIFGFEPVSIKLETYTSGGAEDGKSECRWKLGPYGWNDRFRETFDNYHSSTLTTMYAGSYNYKINCKDVAENEANYSTDFKISVDNRYPVITRVYHDGGSLVVETEEPSTCAYSTDTCYFDFNEGERMSGSDRFHTTGWQIDYTYHIKCRDIFNNEPGGCSIKTRAVDIN